MARKYPQPFWRESRSCYFVQIKGKQIRLHPEHDEAFRIYHQLMSQKPEERALATAATLATPSANLVLTVLDSFLDWCRLNNAPRTYEYYRENIQRFATRIPKTMTVAELKPFHVTQVMSNFPNWGNNTKNDFIASIKRAFNWAVDEELIERNPLARLKKPAREAREMAVTPEEYARVIETVEEPRFRDLIELAWETGSRGQELGKLEARFVDLSTSRILLPPSKAKGKKYHRVIYLTKRAREIVARLCTEAPNGPLLLNTRGNAWTKDAINSAFCRLQLALGRRSLKELGIEVKLPGPFRSTGIPADQIAAAKTKDRAFIEKAHEEALTLARQHGKKYHLSAFRKGYATEALKNGVDTVTVAHLLGHTDASMVSRVYAKVQQDPKFMAEAASRAKGLKAED